MPERGAPSTGRLGRAGRAVRLAIWLNWAICVICYVVMLLEVQSVIVSGPLIFLCGLALFVTAAVTRCAPVVWIGLANCSVCVLFFGAVLLFTWSPGDASAPFALMGAAYLLGLLPLVLHAHRKAPRVADDRCAVCDYLLIGLPEPRCPECGTRFDPSTVRGSVNA